MDNSWCKTPTVTLVPLLGELVIMPSQIFAINAWIGSCNIDLDPAICGGGRRPRSTVDGGRSQRSVKGRDAIDARGELAGTAPHLGMRVKSTRLSNSSCGLSTSWKSDQNQSKVSEAGALEGVRFPLRTCVITIRLRDLRRCLCSLHDLSLLFSRSGRSIVASQPHTHTTTIPSHPLNERTHAMRP